MVGKAYQTLWHSSWLLLFCYCFGFVLVLVQIDIEITSKKDTRQPVMSSAPQTLWHWLLKSDPITLPLAWLPARRTRTLKYNSLHYHKNFGKDRILKTQQFEARNNRALFQNWKNKSWYFQQQKVFERICKKPEAEELHESLIDSADHCSSQLEGHSLSAQQFPFVISSYHQQPHAPNLQTM